MCADLVSRTGLVTRLPSGALSRLTAIVAQVALCAALVTMSVGCAFGDRKISLTYEPALDASVKGAGKVGVVKFDDARQDKVTVGEIRNGWGIRTASIIAPDHDAGAWMADAIVAELDRAGISVTKHGGPGAATDAIRITGSVLEIYSSPALGNRCKVRGTVVVQKGGTPVLNKEYFGVSTSANWAAAASQYEKGTQEALQNMLKAAVPEILDAMK